MNKNVEQLLAAKDDAWWAEWLAKWDAMQDAYFPQRRHVFRLMAEILADRFPNGCRVADIGAGTGTLAEEILNRVPGSTILCLDVEPFLLAGARKRLKPFGDRARVIRVDFRKEDFTTEITENTEQDGGRRALRARAATRPTSQDVERRDSVADGGHRGARPTSTDIGSGDSVVGRAPPRPPKPRSGAPRNEITENTKRETAKEFEAVVSSTTLHWFGQSILQRIYAWASRILVENGLFLNADHIQPDDPDLAQLALDLNETVRACLFQQSGAPTWDEFWDGLGEQIGIPTYHDTVACPAWGEQDGPEAGYPFAVHDRLLRGLPSGTLGQAVGHRPTAGFRHIAILWRHLPDALLLATR